MADGTIEIDVDIPVRKVKSDAQEIDDTLKKIGKDSGKELDSSFDSNAEKVKKKAKSTGDYVDKELGKKHKTKIEADNSDAKKKASDTKKDIDNIPKKHDTKIEANNSDAKKKAKETKDDVDKVPKDHETKFKGNNDDAKHKADETKDRTEKVPKHHNTDFDATDHTGGVFAKIKRHFDDINSEGKRTHSLFSSIFSANIVSNVVTSGFGKIKDALVGMTGQAKQYALEQQTMNATWLTLTNSASKGKAMVDQINQMAVSAQNSTQMVDQLSQKFYAINNNAKQTGELTKSILTLQDAFGATDAEVENFGTQFSQMMANGKVSAQDMMSIVNVFPKLRPMLLDYERRIHHNSNMTMAEMNKMMSAGKIKSADMIKVVEEAGVKFQKATGNFTKTIPGMTRVVQSQMPVLLGAFTKPLAKAESPVYSAISKWVSSKKTANMFTTMGKTVSTGMSQVMKAFSGGGESVDITKKLDDALTGLNSVLKATFGWIADHAKDLKDIAKDVGSIAFQIGKSVWKDFSSIIGNIGKMFGLVNSNGKGSSSAIHVIAEALNNLAKNKTAIKVISDAIVAMAVVKGLDRVGGGLFAIGEKGYHAYKNVSLLVKGMKGIKDIKGLTDAEKGFVKSGNVIRSVAKGIKTGVVGVAKGFKIFGKAVWSASKELGGKFVQQLKLIGSGIKGLGNGVWKIAKTIGGDLADAGKFLGKQMVKGFKNAIRLSKAIGSKLISGTKSLISKSIDLGKQIGKAINTGFNKSVDFGKGLLGKGNGAGRLNGLLQSQHSAGGFKNLSMAGKIATGTAYAGVAVDSGLQIMNAVKDRHSATKRSADIGGAIGSAVGGGLATAFLGPEFAPVGIALGKAMGKVAGKGVNSFTKGWQSKKPPKEFWSLQNLGWSAHSMWSGFQKSVGSILKWFKKNWKEISLYFVSPLAGAINSLYKHNPKFRKWVNTMVKDFKKAWKRIVKWFSSLGKGIQKSWRGMTKWFTKLGRNMAKGLRSAWKTMAKWFGNIAKGIRNAWHSMTSWFGRLGRNMAKGLRSAWRTMTKWFTGIARGIRNAWHGMTSWFTKLGSGMAKGIKSAWKGMTSWFSNIAKGIKGVFDNLWDGIKQGASNAVNGIIDGINGASDTIKNATFGKVKLGHVSHVHFARGTDWRRKYPMIPAILNDGHDSPRTHNRESIIHGDGSWELLPNVPNLKRLLLADDEVVNARDTAMLTRRFSNAVHFANGSIDLNDLRITRQNNDLLQNISDDLDEHLQISWSNIAKGKKKDAESKSRYAEQDRITRENARNLKFMATKSAKSSESKAKTATKTSSKKRKSSSNHKGQTLVDTALLTGARKNTGNYSWVNKKIFEKLMSYSKIHLPKVHKNSRIRYRPIETRSAGKGLVKIDTSWLQGLKHLTGRMTTITHEEYLRLLSATKNERKYKLPKKKRKKTKRRTSTKRRSSSSSTRRTYSYSTRRSSGRSSRSASVSLSGASALKSLTGKSIKIKASISGLKSVKSLAKAIKSVKGKKNVKVKVKGLGDVKKLSKDLKSIGSKSITKGIKTASSRLNSLSKRGKRASSVIGKLKSSARKANSGLKSLSSRLSSTSSRVKKLYNATKKNKFGAQIKKQAEEAVKSLKGKGNFAKEFESLTKKFDKDLKSMAKNADKDFKSMWSSIHKSEKSGEDHIESLLRSFSTKFKRGWSSLESGIRGSFNHFWSTMKSDAVKGLRKVIGTLNSAIHAIDNVVGQFGGNKSAIHTVHFATGTGALGGMRRPITRPTFAVVNDGHDSPETGNKEAKWNPVTGDISVFHGRNVPTILMPGEEILNASEARDLGITKPQHFATGTGALKKLYEQAKKYWRQPKKTGEALFGNVNGLSGAVNAIAQGMNKLGTNNGVEWWSQLWKMVEDKVNSGDADVSGFLKKAIEVSKGHRYVWGAHGPDVFDCSGLVQYVAHLLGIPGLHQPSGSEYGAVEHIPRSEARMNDLVFYGNGGDEHVGIVKDKHTYWSAHSPSSHPNIGWDSIDDAPTHPILFGRIRGYHPKDEDKGDSIKANNKIQKQIKQQVGKGFLKTIEKIAQEFGDSSLPNVSGSALAWKSYIKRASEQMHTSVTSTDIAKIISMISGESHGDAKITQPGKDPDGDGSGPARGLLQFKTGTFDTFKVHGHGNIYNGYDQLLALFNDSNWKSDIHYGAGWGPNGHRRFANGGIVSAPETIDVAEAGHPESIVPWDPAKRERAYAVMEATLRQFKAQDGMNQKLEQNQANIDLTQTNKAIDSIDSKFNEVLSILGVIVGQDKVIQIQNNIDNRAVGQTVYKVVKRLNAQSIRNEANRFSGI